MGHWPVCVKKEMLTNGCPVWDEVKNEKTIDEWHVWSGVEWSEVRQR